MNRPALIISILLTALVLTIAGGVAYSVHNIQVVQAAQSAQAAQAVQVDNQSEQAAQAAGQVSGADGQAAIDPQLQQTLLDREAAYQKMIADANARLAQDQQAMQALQAQVVALQNPAAANPAAAANAAASGVSPQNAVKIAAEYLGQTKVYSIETAAFNGANVFKVTFSSGDIVMVSFAGDVLTVQKAPHHNSSEEQLSASSSAGEHESEHEYEGGDY